MIAHVGTVDLYEVELPLCFYFSQICRNFRNEFLGISNQFFGFLSAADVKIVVIAVVADNGRVIDDRQILLRKRAAVDELLIEKGNYARMLLEIHLF